MSVYLLKGFRVMGNSPLIEVFNQTNFYYEAIYICEFGKIKNLEYFKGKYHLKTESKIVQTTDREVALIGGKNYAPTLLTREYDVGRSCLLVDCCCGVVTEKAQMNMSRDRHGAARINSIIYVVAGRQSDAGLVEKSCERYDLLTDRWTILP